MSPAVRSIRLSLVAYFLVLLALALGAVSYLSYQANARTLRKDQETRAELLRTNLKKAEADEEERFKHELLSQARIISPQVTAQLNVWQRVNAVEAVSTVGGLIGALAPEGQLSVAWIKPYHSRWTRQLWGYSLSRALPTTELQFDEDLLRRDGESGGPEFIQINSGKAVWRSRSLGTAELPFDEADYKDRLDEPRFDYLTLPGHPPLERVILRTPVRIRLPRPPNGDPSRRGGIPLPPPSEPRDPRGSRPYVDIPPMSIFIHCANPTTPRDQKLQELREQFRQDIAALDEGAYLELLTLRDRLLGISLITFTAAVAGVWLLTWMGLAPLRRLSDAVSGVSERDFRLKVDASKLPRELTPIADRLSHTLQQLSNAFEREKRAAADISHELRTPVAALLTTIEVALRKPRSAEDYREVLTDCHETGKQMSQLVERMLALAWVDSGGARVRPTEFDAADLAARCANTIRPIAEARGLTVRTKARGLVSVTADPDKVREILVNLLHNAVEYNRPGGTVEIDVRRDGDEVVLEVSDTGIGVPEEIRGQIFERFFRADPSRQATGLHAGLGLAIVREYAELMGGTITVESTVGVGSTFRLRLPDPAE
jgi:heavy metal sensor kinase